VNHRFRQRRNTGTRDRCGAQKRLAAVHRCHRQDSHRLAVLEQIDKVAVLLAELRIDQQKMSGQIIGACRYAVFAQIGWRSDQHARGLRQGPANHCGLLDKMRRNNGYVITSIVKIDHMLLYRHCQVHVRCDRVVVRHQPQEGAIYQHGMHDQTKVAAVDLPLLHDPPIRLIKFLEQPAATQVIGLCFFRQGHRPGGPMQETRLHGRLEFGNGFRNGPRRHAERSRRLAETFMLRRCNEGSQHVKLVHHLSRRKNGKCRDRKSISSLAACDIRQSVDHPSPSSLFPPPR
jgi:hypothetical protein